MKLLRWAVILPIFLFSCSIFDPGALRVTSPLPSGIISQNSVFSLTFSRAVAPAESLKNWTTTPYLVFDPPIEGKFVWEDSIRLVFSPDQLLPGDASFSARINTELLKSMAKTESFGGDEEFTFSTRPFLLEKVEFFYDRIDERRTVGIRANLEFSYAVSPTDVQRTLRVAIEDEASPTVKIMATAPARIIPVEIGNVKTKESGRTIEVDFEDGLISSETKTPLRKDRAVEFTLPGLAQLTILGHEILRTGVDATIRFRTSQEVDLPGVRALVKVEPERPFTVERIDGPGFALKGVFDPGTKYLFTISKGLSSVLGATINNDYTADVIVGNVKPSFDFVSGSGSYMLLTGSRSLGIQTMNIPKLQVRVSQVFRNNIVHFLDRGRWYDWYWDNDGGSRPRKYRYDIGNFGRRLEVKEIEPGGSSNQTVETRLDLTPYMRTDYKGFLLVEMSNAEESWRTTSKLVVVSDIGLIVKQSDSELRVFGVSLATAEPISGLEVSLISTSNQTIATATTERNGEATFAPLKSLLGDFDLKLITASKGDDFSFIHLSDYRVETSRFDVGGRNDLAGQYDTFIYGDRNLYRPGDTVIVTGIVRSTTGAQTRGLPMRLTVYTPKGSKFQEHLPTLDDQGAFELRMPTTTAFLTGPWRFDLSTGNDVFLSSYTVNVEDFVPDRLKVRMKTSKTKADPGDKIEFSAEAVNFFGPPAAGRSYEFEGRLSDAPFRSERFSEFRFNDDSAPEYQGSPYVHEGRTNAQGQLQESYEIPSDLHVRGTLIARGRVAVFDESGRPVYQVAQATVYPRKAFVGVRSNGAYYVRPGTPNAFRVVAVDAADQTVAGAKARVSVIRREWHSVLRQDTQGGALRYMSEIREIPVETKDITLSSEATEHSVTVPRSGDYSVRVSLIDDPGYTEFRFYAYDWGSSDLTSFQIDPEARVEIVTDKKVYAPGEKARLLFQAPFDGTMLVTIERNRVLKSEFVEVRQNAASLELKVDDAYLPNVYVSAVLFRKVKERTLPLMAGHGFAPLMVERPSNRIGLTIDAPEKVRPKTRQTVTVRAGDDEDVAVTIAAVDEGILQQRGMATPDPYGHFYAKRALETQTFDFFRDLLPELTAGQKSSTGGGDMAMMMAQRTSPISTMRFKPVSLWSGRLRTDGSGMASVTFDIPEFSGELRLMAVAYQGTRYGSAQRGMKVADPVVLTVGLPRFLAPGDDIQMTITAFNTTSNSAPLDIRIATNGPLVPAQTSTSLTVEPDRERVATVGLKAGPNVGAATVRVTTEAFGEKFESVTEIPVRPISPYTTEATHGQLAGGTSATHTLPDVFLPFGQRAFVTMSPLPIAQLSKELKSLVGYPYGCLEQTTSKAFPQLYLRDIAMVLDPSIVERGSPTYFVNEAIAKIAGMQMHDGAFNYWPGGGYTNTWSTVYATHFLVEAEKAGYAVSSSVKTAALSAIRQIARQKNTEDYYWYGRGRTTVTRVADKASVYALYVLAVAGQPEKPVMDFYRTAPSLLVGDTRTLLAGAYAHSGDRAAFIQIMPASLAPEEPMRTTGRWFDSPIRAQAIILNVLLDTDPDNADIARLIEYLGRAYKSNGWYSTQENAFTLLAFGKAARRSGSAGRGTVTMDGRTMAYNGGTQRIDLPATVGALTVQLEGTGRVFYSVVTEGIRKDGAVTIEDKNLRIRREFFDRFGAPVDLNSVKQNALVVVRLTLTADVNDIENIAVSDLLPAGLEIENPRLEESEQYGFLKNISTAEYVDIRDDRINYFTEFKYGGRTRTFAYLARAVSRGRFQLPPITAAAMYDGSYTSTYGRGMLTVVE